MYICVYVYMYICLCLYHKKLIPEASLLLLNLYFCCSYSHLQNSVHYFLQFLIFKTLYNMYIITPK